MTQYNYNEIKSDSLQQVVKFLDNLARDYFAEGYASNDYRKTCQQIGALSAVLDKLAEKMGDLWLFGADFVEDADQLRAFCAFVVAMAEKLAELAEVEDLTIINKAVARVEHWIAKGAETAKYFEEQAKAEQATVGSVEQLEAERAEVADLLATSERAIVVLTKRIEKAKAEALTASKMNARETWSTAEDKAVKLSAELDNLRALADADRAELDAIENRLAFLKGQEANREQMTTPTEAAETAPESENDREQDNTPTNGGQIATESENEPQADNTANGSRLANAKAYAAAAWSWFIGWLVGGASLLACVLVPVVAWLVVQSLAEVPHEFTGGDWFALIGGGSLCLVGMPCGWLIFREIYKYNTWAWCLSHARG